MISSKCILMDIGNNLESYCGRLMNLRMNNIVTLQVTEYMKVREQEGPCIYTGPGF